MSGRIILSTCALTFALCLTIRAQEVPPEGLKFHEMMKEVSNFLSRSVRFDPAAGQFTLEAEPLREFATKLLTAYAAGRTVPPERMESLQDALVRHVLTLSAHFTNEREAPQLRQVLQDLLLNRRLLSFLLTSAVPHVVELLPYYLTLYTERTLRVTGEYKPRPPTPQLVLPEKFKGEVRIVPEKLLLVYDLGTSGHRNRAIDAGETIALNITLKNHSQKRAYRSTSCFLESDDPFVVIHPREVIYDYRPETPTIEEWPPGEEVTPKENFVFTIASDCPDQYVIPFRLLVWDSKWGKAYQEFGIKVYNVGPLSFGEGTVDDDIPGPSEGDGDGLMEPGEKIEFVLGIKNEGQAQVQEVVADLSTDARFIRFSEARRPYPSIEPEAVKEVIADFDFEVGKEEEIDRDKVVLVLRTKVKAYGFDYQWERPFLLPVGLSEKAKKLIALRRLRALKPERVPTLKGHGDDVESVAFSPDGRLLASGSGDDTVKLWDVQSRDCLVTLKGHRDWVRSVAFSPYGRLLASGSGDDTVKLWDVQREECVATLTGHSESAYEIAFSPQGLLLASGSKDGTVKLWRPLYSRRSIATLEIGSSVAAMAFSPDGQLLAARCNGVNINLWSLWPTEEAAGGPQE